MAEDTKNLTLFIPAAIDDYGFTPEEFRVFSRIMRRSLGGSVCYESVQTLVKTLCISGKLIRRALKVLEACGAINRTVRPGQSDVFDFNPLNTWKSSAQLPSIRAYIDAEFKAKDCARKTAKKQLPLVETQGATPGGNATPPLVETQGLPLVETQHDGIPLEGSPLKGAETPAEQFKTFAENPVVKSTESVLNFSLDNFAAERIETVVPLSLKTEWLELVRNRLVGNETKPANYLKTRIGYWLGDFQKDYRRQLSIIATETKQPTVRTMEEKRAAFEKQHYSNRKQPVIYIGGAQ